MKCLVKSSIVKYVTLGFILSLCALELGACFPIGPGIRAEYGYADPYYYGDIYYYDAPYYYYPGFYGLAYWGPYYYPGFGYRGGYPYYFRSRIGRGGPVGHGGARGIR